MLTLSRRWRITLISIVLFFLLIGGSRLVQVALGNRYSGDRAPYLQMPSADQMVLRWQTHDPEEGEVRYGRGGVLDNVLVEHRTRREHELTLKGLQAGTRYSYQVGSGGTVRYGGEDYWFQTAPVVGSESARFLVLGDPGYANPAQDQVRDAALAWGAQHPREGRPVADFILTTGDNAYTSGTNEQFQSGFFTPYAGLLRNLPVWPGYGNHDARRWAFFKVFTLPTQGESGGVASGTENYYSFDYANVHVVMLDSQGSSRRDNGAMMRWLKQDLAANSKTWLITYMHHPPYTHGGHNSDDRRDSDGRMQDMRERFLPVLEAAGADLVLNGHSHDYERSHLLNCHYSDSSTLTPAMIRQRASGMGDSFQKHSVRAGTHEGTVYAVVGASAKLDDGVLDHPAMPVSLHQRGALMIDINGNALNAEYINQEGQVSDRFTILKGVEAAPLGQTCDNL